MTGSELEEHIAGIAALDQPLRRNLYRFLVAAGDWRTRDAAAAAMGISRPVAAFHLDKLVDAGVLDVRFERMSGRQGPGAGRPSKLYRTRYDELSASVPERHYDLAGSLLATAVAESSRTGAPVRDCLRAAAGAAGRQVGDAARRTSSGTRRSDEQRQAIVETLVRHGYEPEVGRRNEIAMANCPFHRLADEQRDLVCGMNLDFLTGLLEGIEGSDRLAARLDPAPGYCCVRIAKRTEPT